MSYIEKIEDGAPLNIKALLNILEKEGISQVAATNNMCVARVGKSTQYQVESINQDFLEKLKSLVMHSNATRADAAKLNKSHAVRVNGSFILRRIGCAHPDVVIIGDDGAFSSSTGNRKALIIENRQNFLSIEATINFLQTHCDLTIDSSWDVLFGAGGEISNHLHTKYLAVYTEVFMFLDIDLGGLKVAKSVSKRAPKARHHFILPYDINNRLKSSPVIATQETLEATYKIAKSTPFLLEASNCILSNKSTLEQESYLA